MTILDYFKDRIGEEPCLKFPARAGDTSGETLGDILNGMDLATSCGDDCARVINHGAELLVGVQDAFGIEIHPKAFLHRHAVCLAIIDTCCCFIRG